MNTARGPIVDHDALRRRLIAGEIAGAALDVTDPEPLPPDDPLLSAPNLIVVPHIGSATRVARERMADLAVDNLLAGLDGRPMPHQVGRPDVRRAVVDIGTNSTRLFIADVDDGKVVDVLERRTAITRLGAGVDADGRLSPDAMDRVFSVLDEYRELIDRDGVARSVAVLTSAVRDASNGAEFASTVGARWGLEPHILTGDEEARLTFLGATSERDPDDHTPTLVMDIGGGSTELVIGAGREMTFHVSAQAGVVRQTERHLDSDPPRPEELDELASRCPVDPGVRGAGGAPALGGVGDRGGGDRDLDGLDLPGARPLRPGQGGGIRGQRRSVPEDPRPAGGVDAGRAPAGARAPSRPRAHDHRRRVILLETLALFGLSSFEVSENDILRGAALGLD